MFRLVASATLLSCLVGCQTEPAKAASASPEPPATGVPDARAGEELVGTPALPFSPRLVWLNSEPLSLEQLEGQVVLVRFWTDTCPFCEASAPGLTELHERFADQGLVVVGLFHPKPRGSVRDIESVKARARELDMAFPIATDSDWDTLERWWLSTGDRAATSVSFLIDAGGTVRWIHPGPEFHPGGPADHEQCRRDYEDAVAAIEALLAEREGAEKKVG